MRPIQPLPKPFREGYTYCLSLIGFQRCNNDNSMVLATINVQRFTRRTATITIINNPDWYRRDSQLKDRLTNSKIKICTFSKRIEFLGNSINFERNFETKFVENVFFFGEDWGGVNNIEEFIRDAAQSVPQRGNESLFFENGEAGVARN